MPQRIPESYVESTITSRIEDRLQSISQQILSRTRLERIINEFNLYARARRTGDMENVVERMRRDINVETVKGDAFRVWYISGDQPATAKVTNRLASLFIEENLRDREVLAEGTNQFLESQLECARHRLAEREKKVEEYRRRYSGELPSQVESNLQMIQNTQLQVQTISRRSIATATAASSWSDRSPTRARSMTPSRRRLRRRTAARRVSIRSRRLAPICGGSRCGSSRSIPTSSRRAGKCASSSRGRGSNRAPPVGPRVPPARAQARRRESALEGEMQNLDRQIATKRRSTPPAVCRFDVSGTRGGGADARVGADRADARLQHAAAGLREPPRERRGLESRREPRAERTTSSSACLESRRARRRAVRPRPRAPEHHGRDSGLALGFGLAAFVEYATRRYAPTRTSSRRWHCRCSR